MNQFQLFLEGHFATFDIDSLKRREASTDWTVQTLSYWRSQSRAVWERPSLKEIHVSFQKRFSEFHLSLDMKVFPIPSRISDEAAEFLFSQSELAPVSIEVLQSMTESLRREGLIAESAITLEQDYEAPDINVLVFSFEVHGLPYERILELWDDILPKVYARVPRELASKIAIVMDEMP